MRCAMLKRRPYLVAAMLALCSCDRPEVDDTGATGLRFLSEIPNARSFERAETAREFEFPRDHGMHSKFATEWWYFTGNLNTAAGRHFGFELTFFRYALSATSIQRPSAWGSNQVWLAHFTLTDTHNERFLSAERMGRGALGIADAQMDQLSVHVRDWSARSTAGSETIELAANSAATSISLRLTDPAPVALHGEDGLDRKGAEAGNASYYYSVPRMTAAGTIRLSSGESLNVTGTAWLDREWGTSSLDDGVDGWDWFGLQLDDGTNLMLYRLRNADGSMNELSTGTVMYPDGRTGRLEPDAVRYEIVNRWTSPSSGVTYPIEWRVSIPGLNLDLGVKARIENQEFNLGLRYWEGAVAVSGIAQDRTVSGVGYLELAGYR
jgi:predicted secreted hydrolase